MFFHKRVNPESENRKIIGKSFENTIAEINLGYNKNTNLTFKMTLQHFISYMTMNCPKKAKKIKSKSANTKTYDTPYEGK